MLTSELAYIKTSWLSGTWRRSLKNTKKILRIRLSEKERNCSRCINQIRCCLHSNSASKEIPFNGHGSRRPSLSSHLSRTRDHGRYATRFRCHYPLIDSDIDNDARHCAQRWTRDAAPSCSLCTTQWPMADQIYLCHRQSGNLDHLPTILDYHSRGQPYELPI